MPYILTTFANDQQAHLPELKREDDAVYEALFPGFIGRRYTIFRESFVTRDILVKRLRELRFDLFCFHYSGHASTNLLHLEDGVAHPEGILKLLSKCLPKLKLVVLNGCGTIAQAEALYAAGIPCVIATTAPVDDRTAASFATTFYKELMGGKPIQEAFDEGLITAQTIRDNIGVIRTPPEADVDMKQGTWCFFSQEKSGELKLPVVSNYTEVLNFKPNSIVTESLYMNTSLQSEDLKVLRTRDENGDSVRIDQRRRAIYTSLPAPVGEQLRRLFDPGKEDGTYNKLGLDRLGQIIMTYERMMETLIYTLMAQLYEYYLREDERKIEIPLTLYREIQDFFGLSAVGKFKQQFIYLIRNIRSFLESVEADFFVSEMIEIAEFINDDRSVFAAACSELEAVRLQLGSVEIPINSVGQMCKEAEEHLAEVLGHLGFMSNYTVTTVQNIDIIKYKHQASAQFLHQKIDLVGVQGEIEVAHLQTDDFMDNRSVLLTEKSEKVNPNEMPRYLNLSPFIIDRSAFETKEFAPQFNVSDLNILFSYDEKNEVLKYRSLRTPSDKLWQAKKRVEISSFGKKPNPMKNIDSFRESHVFEQFETFMNLLSNAKATPA